MVFATIWYRNSPGKNHRVFPCLLLRLFLGLKGETMLRPARSGEVMPPQSNQGQDNELVRNLASIDPMD